MFNDYTSLCFVLSKIVVMHTESHTLEATRADKAYINKHPYTQTYTDSCTHKTCTH